MTKMLVCGSCERYVREGSESCPFCATQLNQQEVRRETLAAAPGRSRAAVFAMRSAVATAATAAALACGEDGERSPVDGTGGQANSDTGGQASVDPSTGGQGSGGDDGIELGGADGLGGLGGYVGVPIYGGPFPDMVRAKV